MDQSISEMAEALAPEGTLEQRYLKVCNELELKSLEVSKASKALNKLKEEQSALSTRRDEMRRKLMDAAPHADVPAKPLPHYPYGHRGSGRFA
jgi:uncharacterized protein involved in exopolysaccharide biosynthesis